MTFTEFLWSKLIEKSLERGAMIVIFTHLICVGKGHQQFMSELMQVQGARGICALCYKVRCH